MNDKNCPKCQSEKIFWLAEPKVFICTLCANQWSNTNIRSEQFFCQELASSGNWQSVIFNNYPAPIAHEYKQLQNILADGKFVSSMLQLKDVVEVIVKLSAVTMYQWLAIQKNDQYDFNKLNLISSKLLTKPLSLGAWIGILRELSYLILSGCDANAISNDSIGIKIAKWLYDYRGRKDEKKESFKATQMSDWLEQMTEWRNNEIGHGALRIDHSEQFKDFEEKIDELHILLSNQNPWQEYKLVIANELTSDYYDDMTGWQSIIRRHDALNPINNNMHRVEYSKLFLEDKNNLEIRVELSPFIEAKVCSYCNLKDVFIFDGIDRNRYFCVDYLSGHRLKLATSTNDSLQKILNKKDFVIIDESIIEDQTIDQDTINESLLSLFEVKSLELGSNFTTPTYLNNQLRDYLENYKYDSGLFWLQAPAHIGKSTFIQGLANKEIIKQSTVISFHIRREYRYFAHHFTEHLYDEMQKELSKKGANKPLPRINLLDKDIKSENMLVDWLNKIWSQRPQKLANNTLLVAINGLDEVGKPHHEEFSQLSIIDLLPSETSNQLNEGIYIILTSRPVDKCPNWMQSELKRKLLANSYQVGVDQQNQGYLNVLRTHFSNNLENSLKGISNDNRDQIFKTLLNKSQSLFLYFSMLVEQINSQQLSLADITKLPLGEELYGHFIDQLEHILGKQSKGFGRIKDILTLLTACEQAFYNDTSIQEESMTVDGEILSIGYSPSWYGVDAEILAGLLNEPHGAYSSQFIFSLFTIKSLMKVERSSDKAKYAIGLKDFSSYIAERWMCEVNDWHKRLSVQFYELWEGINDHGSDSETVFINHEISEVVYVDYHIHEIAENNYLNRYALSHAKLAKEADLFSDINYYDSIIENESIRHFFHHNYTINELNLFMRHALVWLNMEIYCQINTKAFANKLKFYTAEDSRYQVNKIWLELARNYIYRGDALVYMEQENDAQINYELASSLCKLEWTGSYDDRLVILLGSLSKSNVNENKYEYDAEDFNSIENYKFKLLEHKYYLNEALLYLDSMESHAEIFDSPNFKKQSSNFRNELKLAEARIISKEAYKTLFKCDPYNTYGLIYDYDIKKVYRIYKEVIKANRPDMKLELAIHYFKLSNLTLDGQNDKEEFDELNDAVTLIYDLLESLDSKVPLKYRYYLALLTSAKWSKNEFSGFSKIFKDLSIAANILEEDKKILQDNNEFIPKSWDEYLSKVYFDIDKLNLIYGSMNDTNSVVDNQDKLIELKNTALRKAQNDHLRNPSTLTESVIVNIKKELINAMQRKKASHESKIEIIELNISIIKLIKSLITSDAINIDNIYSIFSDYMECANSYLDLSMQKEADLIVREVQNYFAPMINEEMKNNEQVIDLEAVAIGYRSLEYNLRKKLIGGRESYFDCLYLLTYINEDDEFDDNIIKQKYRYILELRVLLDSMLVDTVKFFDQINNEMYDLELFPIVERIIGSYSSLFQSQIKYNQSEYGFIEYLQDTNKLIKHVDKYINQTSSNIDKVKFLNTKISIYNDYFIKDRYINLKQHDTLIRNLDTSIEIYEYIDEIFYNMSSHDFGIVNQKFIESIQGKLKLKKEKADLSIKINNPNDALTLYTECISSYANIINNLPHYLYGIRPSRYAVYRKKYISIIYDIVFEMLSINKYYLKNTYGIKHEIEIPILKLDNFQLNNFYGLESINRSSVDHIYKLQTLACWDSQLFTSTVKCDIRNANDKNSHSKIYLEYLNRLDFVNEWTGNLEQDITNPSYKYHEDDIEGYIGFVALLKAQISSFTDFSLAVEQYSMIENICEELLKTDNIDYFLKLKSNLDIEYHPRVEKIYKQVLDNDKCLIELRASLAIASFGKACTYELLDASYLYNYQMALDSYARAISELNKINSTILGIDDYGYSNELTHFLIKVHDSRANLYNNLHKLELAKIDCEKVAQLHYTTCFSKIISIEDQVDWFLQGMLFINDNNNGFHNSRTFDLSSIEQPLRIFNYPIFEDENIILKLFQLKFDLTILNSAENSFKNDFILLANILHTLGNALVLDAIQNNSLSKWEFSISPSVYEGDPATSAHMFSAVGQVQNAFKFVKILNGHESHYDNLRIAVKLHTQAISIMTQHDYVYNPIWDFDLSISTQLLEYKNNQSEMFDIPF